MPLTQVQTSGIANNAVTADQIDAGAVTGDDLEDSGVTAGTYGSSSAIPAITVDAKGRVTSASTNSIDSTAITNGTSNVSVAASGDITATRAGTTRLTVNSTGIEVDGVADFDSTDAILLPTGTTAQRSTEVVGAFRFNSDLGFLEYYNGTNWILSSAAAPTISSITGNIVVGSSSTLTLTGTDFEATNLQVRFVQAADSIDETVTVTPTSSNAADVTVPANVFNNVTNGNVVTITVTNNSGFTSAGFSQTAVAFPTGGTVTTSGNFRIHTFTSSGNFVIPTGSSFTYDYFLVAGGGGGGGAFQSPGGGGGGAGGYINSTAQSIAAGTHAVTVGAGGTAGVGDGSQAGTASGNGGDTTFNSETATGGGSGGRYSGVDGGDGGSGGGAGWDGARGDGTAGQGNEGGHYGSGATSNQSGISSQSGPGGGGATAAGTNMTDTAQKASGTTGGDGVSNSYSGSAVTYAGGGGGGGGYGGGTGGTVGGLGGSGGGGQGGDGTSTAANTVGHDGTANTGGGGGGAGAGIGGARVAITAGAGGSGIAIIRYQT